MIFIRYFIGFVYLFLKCVDFTQQSQYLCFGIKNKKIFRQKHLINQKKSKLKPDLQHWILQRKNCLLNHAQSKSYHNLLISPIKK